MPNTNMCQTPDMLTVRSVTAICNVIILSKHLNVILSLITIILKFSLPAVFMFFLFFTCHAYTSNIKILCKIAQVWGDNGWKQRSIAFNQWMAFLKLDQMIID